jgi:hypothetical protein
MNCFRLLNLVRVHVKWFLFLFFAVEPSYTLAVYFADTYSFINSNSLISQSGVSGAGWIEITEGSSRYRGTGVLVADNWVLTAAHNWDASAVTALSFQFGGLSYSASSWVQHPNWISNPGVSLSQGSDLALFQLSSSVLGATPASLYTGNRELGAETTFFGAGLTGSGSSGLQSNPDADLFAGNNTIDRVVTTDSGGLLAFDLDDGTVERNTLGVGGLFDIYGNAINSSPN